MTWVFLKERELLVIVIGLSHIEMSNLISVAESKLSPINAARRSRSIRTGPETRQVNECAHRTVVSIFAWNIGSCFGWGLATNGPILYNAVQGACSPVFVILL